MWRTRQTIERHGLQIAGKCCRYLSTDNPVSKNKSIVADQLLPNSKVVICGGGIMGAATAYYLAMFGWGTEVQLLEQGQVADGRKWHSSGIMGAFKPTLTQVKLAQNSLELIKSLTKSGHDTGWKQCGALNIARTRDRMTSFRRMKSISVGWKIKCELLTPTQCKQLCPILDIDSGILGGLWLPEDGVGNPNLLCQALLAEAQMRGVTIVDNCAVKRVFQEDRKVCLVDTDRGAVECSHFVNCAGFWARQVGELSEPPVKVPIQAMEHYYLHTQPIESLDPNMPILRDLDSNIYVRQMDGHILAGGFEPNAKPAYDDGVIPMFQNQRDLPVDWDHFHQILDPLVNLIPSLRDATLDRLCNGSEAFSPDGRWILGESPEIENYFVAAGMKAVGVSAAGGIGRTIAEMITTGMCEIDMHELDLSRFLGLHNNRKYLRERGKEVPGLHFSVKYPFFEFSSARNLRMSPLFPAFKESGAVFGETMGYERPAWFDKVNSLDNNGKPMFRVATTETYARPHWFEHAEEEYKACREKIGLCDYSSFTKIDIRAKDKSEVVDYLQMLCSNDCDVPIGAIIHTGMQNIRGGYENDASMARLSDNHYFMIAPTIQQTRCMAWLQRNLPPKSKIGIVDVTSMYTAICIMGPFTRLLLSELTDTDLSPTYFPFFTYKELELGMANGIRAFNLTHTGELGYVLYIPNEYALHVYERLIAGGQKFGIKHCGYYAMRALRVEKFYAFWGQDLDTFTTPLECGRTWRVKFDKNFIGRDALIAQRDHGVRRMYVQLLLADHDPEIDLWCCGGEPIFRNNIYCGQTTTTSYGFTFKKQVCLGFVQNLNADGSKNIVTNDYVLTGDYEIEIAGLRYQAKVNLHSPNLPTKYPDQEREAYKATRDKANENSLLTPKTDKNNLY